MADPVMADPLMANPVIRAELMNRWKLEPSSMPAGGVVTQPGPDIPALREQLAILVSTGKAREAIGVQLTHEQVKRLSDKNVEKHYKRHETYMGSKTTETLIESSLMLATKAVGALVRLKDADALQNELKNDYIITKQLSALAGGLALRCGRLLAVANAALITTKHIDFSSSQRDADDYPPDEVPVVEQSSATAE